MSHSIQGFIVSRAAVMAAASQLRHSRPVAAGQGLYFVPVTDDVFDALSPAEPSEGETDFSDFQRLSEALSSVARRLSSFGPLAYVETDYFGGGGTQSAVVWDQGLMIYPPRHRPGGVINDALRLMGVRVGEAHDEFDAIGLRRFRSNEAWLEEPRA